MQATSHLLPKGNKKDYIFSLDDACLIYIDAQCKMLKNYKISNASILIEKTVRESHYYERHIKYLKYMQSKQTEWLKENITQELDKNYYI